MSEEFCRDLTEKERIEREKNYESARALTQKEQNDLYLNKLSEKINQLYKEDFVDNKINRMSIGIDLMYSEIVALYENFKSHVKLEKDIYDVFDSRFNRIIETLKFMKYIYIKELEEYIKYKTEYK